MLDMFLLGVAAVAALAYVAAGVAALFDRDWGIATVSVLSILVGTFVTFGAALTVLYVAAHLVVTGRLP